MNLLAFDTALAACSAVVWRGGEVRARRSERRARGHAEALMPMIEAVMAESGLGFAALDCLVVTRGPGTFTGVRIGLAAARGLGLAAGIPVLGLTTLEAVAAGAREAVRDDESLVVALDARRGEVYAQAFDAALGALGEPGAFAPEAAAARAPPGPGLVLGSGADLVAGPLAALRPGYRRVPALDPLPDAAAAAWLGARRIAEVGPPRGAPPGPLYLRSPGAHAASGDCTPARESR